MRRPVARLAVLAIALSAGPGWTGEADLEAGLKAFREGDYATALRVWMPLAHAGDPYAQYDLALLYADGLGVDRDEARAAELYRQAAEAGLAEAQHVLGTAYLTGRGVEQDHVRSADWYRKAAAQGLARAQYSLAAAHDRGIGTAEDPAQAVIWYRRAALQGHAAAQDRLGLLLSEDPLSPATDYAEAVRWLRLAADRGHVEAQWRLGRIFSRGLAGARDYAEAIRWLRQAALEGVGEAQYELGLIYETGPGFRDPAEARRWYTMAVENGFRHANAKLRYDPRLRTHHLRRARIFDAPGTEPVRVRRPDEIRRGPEAPVPFPPSGEVWCDFNHAKTARGGHSKFRCFMMTGDVADGGHYYDEHGAVRPAADAVLILDTPRGPRPVLAARRPDGGLRPLTDRDGFRQRHVRPLELKVKYRSPDGRKPVFEREMYSEVAATRLLWALHYPADRTYRVRRVRCLRCPRDPFTDPTPSGDDEYTAFDDVSVELRYRAGRAENYDPWVEGGWSWGEELYRLRYGGPPHGFTERQKIHFDGLVVLMNVIRQVSTPPEQNRLLCLRGSIQQLAGRFKHCPDTLLLVHDLGATFGRRSPDSLESWRAAPVWHDAATCETALPFEPQDEHKLRRYRIGKAGHAFIVDLLDQLTDAHLRALFEAAGFERYDLTLTSPGEELPAERSAAIIDAWIAAFRDKIERVRRAECSGS